MANKKHILLLLLFLFNYSAFSQIITGVVLDEETNETIPFATIYFGGTFVGTSADSEGNFTIDISEYASMPLKFSAIGYHTFSLTGHKSTELSIVYLKPKVYEINEALVETKSLAKQRRRNLKLFKSEFIGSSANSKNCVITNEEDITFNYDSDRDTLKAYAKKPIHLVNRSLGYNVTYYLDKFEYYRRSSTLYFSGEIIFDKDLYLEDPDTSFLIRRADTYFGSRMHFFRALGANAIESNNFIITDSENLIIENQRLVDLSENGDRYLTYNEQLMDGNNRLIIGYNQKLYSEIDFLKERVFFDEYGYFDPAGVSWEGDMGRFRIADWLPFDYSSRGGDE